MVHRPLSRICFKQHLLRPSSTIYLNDLFSETARSRTLKFDLKHCPLDLYQICSTSAPGVLNGPLGVFDLKIKKNIKNSSELLGSGA